MSKKMKKNNYNNMNDCKNSMTNINSAYDTDCSTMTSKNCHGTSKKADKKNYSDCK